jgi:hypothetical protein
MSLQIRRVVTGHTADGRAKVEIDEAAKLLIRLVGAQGLEPWTR